MRLEHGMYARTKNNGICRITGFASSLTEDYIETEKGALIPTDEILKASHSLVGNDKEPCLIESGDFVNGSEANFIEYEFIYWKTGHAIHYTYIETILTKEQYEKIAYKVGEYNEKIANENKA